MSNRKRKQRTPLADQLAGMEAITTAKAEHGPGWSRGWHCSRCGARPGESPHGWLTLTRQSETDPHRHEVAEHICPGCQTPDLYRDGVVPVIGGHDAEG